MEPFAGLIGAILVSILCITAAKLVGTGATVGGHDILNVAIAIHVTAWILQFIGHGLFEGTNSNFALTAIFFKLVHGNPNQIAKPIHLTTRPKIVGFCDLVRFFC